jgi:hypothetical protein
MAPEDSCLANRKTSCGSFLGVEFMRDPKATLKSSRTGRACVTCSENFDKRSTISKGKRSLNAGISLRSNSDEHNMDCCRRYNPTTSNSDTYDEANDGLSKGRR